MTALKIVTFFIIFYIRFSFQFLRNYKKDIIAIFKNNYFKFAELRPTLSEGTRESILVRVIFY